jgi:hypothetical protein
MTNLNELIAVEKGWEFVSGDEKYPSPHWESSDKKTFCSFVPNYLHDANLYMGLFEEMVVYGKTVIEMNYDFGMYQLIIHKAIGQVYHAKEEDLSEAICKAWLSWKGIPYE